MTREYIKIMLPIMQAFAEGKTLQYRVNKENNEWKDIDNPAFNNAPSEYRIKHETKYRPFETKEECWDEMLKHQPFGWIYSKNESCYYCIISVDEDKIELSPEMQPHSETTIKEYYMEKDYFFFDQALESFEFAFADGTPFGIKEE